MPNKDSFTFSDKLRKSKSVPLSKRLPSIVGGQNKQKRTLVQRAQRDLPFILVAALALLLLPFLSRTGSDDIAGTGDFAWNSMADAPSFAEGGGAEIMPEGSMDDPMKWILGPRSDVKESGATMGTDASRSAYGSSSSGSGYGDDDSSSSSYSSRYSKRTGTSSSSPDYSTRNKYDEQYTTKRTTKKPKVEDFKKSRPAVRQSVVRKGTEINKALRLSQLPGNKGTTGVSHALPLGQGPTRTPGTAFREGIRPVALQRMESHGGVGRGTEGLRAEADRSIREMNAGGPAKANLLASQMRDIDGKPVGDGPGFGGPGAGGAASRLPGGGGPNNQNGYHVDKPWWWDMMQARSQKMWDLLYYEPRRIWYTNMYNYLSQLMNCLFTGNKDGDVSTMFGKSAADSDWACVKNGKEVMPRYNKQKTKNTKDKDGNKTEETVDSSWVSECINIAKGEIIEKPKDDKNFFQVRAECVGLDVLIDWMKGWVKKEYTAECDAVTIDGINKYRVEVKKKGIFDREAEYNNRLSRKAVIALIAKPKPDKYSGKDYDGNEYVVKVMHQQEYSATREELDKMFGNNPTCNLTKVVSFISRRINSNVEYETNRLDSKDDYALIDFSDRAPFSVKYCSGDKSAKSRALTFQDLKSQLNPKRNSVNQCPIPSPEEFAKNMWLNTYSCNNNKIVSLNIDNRAKAEAIIENPAGKYVFAVAVEQLTNMTEPEIRYIKSYGQVSRLYADKHDVDTYGYEYDAEKGGFHFYFETNLAVEGFNQQYGTATAVSQINRTSVMSGGQVVQDAEATRQARATENREVRAYNQAMCDKCKSEHAEELTRCENSAMRLFSPQVKDGVDTNANNRLSYINNCMTSCTDVCGKATAGSFDSAQNSTGDGINTVRGDGKIFWIVTSQSNLDVTTGTPDSIKGKSLDQLVPTDFAKDSGTTAICHYRWCEDYDTCSLLPNVDEGMYCKAEDGKFYSYQTIEIEGHKYNLRLELKSDHVATGEEPACAELCKDEEGINCPHRKIKYSEEDIMKLFPPGYVDIIPSCIPYCQYKGKVYKTAYVEETGEYYIIDSTPVNKQGSFPKCTPLAWSWRTGADDFYVYRFMGEYNDTELPLTPNSLDSALKCTLGTHNTYTVDLSFLDRSDLFITIRGQAIASGKPREFPLFPKLELPEEVRIDLVYACNFCGPSLYDNADVRADNEKAIKPITAKIRNCFNQVRELEKILGSEDEDIQQLKSVYFYGYASKRGSHDPYMIPGYDRVGCTTSKHGDGSLESPKRQHTMWDLGFVELGDCNKALSEDRNLYIMDKVITNLSGEFGINVSKYPDHDYSGLRGFSNTLPIGVRIIDDGHRNKRDNTYRLIKQPKATGDEFEFISYPCGSLGAIADYDANKNSTQAKNDRLVLITPVNEGDDYCESRMSCDVANTKMTAIENSIKAKLKGRGIAIAEVSSRGRSNEMAFVTATQSDEDFISAEEIAEAMIIENSEDPNANPRA